MGAYLSEPVKEKHSIDESNDFLQVGASSMQGWRISQEDAHNCILKLDENTSYFAVYDGHGGAEVAKYCSEKLPDFLKNLKSFKDGNFDEALKEAFLKFDATLLEDGVIDELKKIAGERNPADSNSDMVDEEEEEDLAELCQEGSLPLEKVLAKYKATKAAAPQVDKIKSEEIKAGGSGTSKPMSPRLRGRRNADKNSENDPASSTSSGGGASSSTNVSDSNDDSQVSSSETKCISDKKENEEQNEMKSNEAVSASGETSKTNGENSKKTLPSASSSSTVQSSTSPDSSISNSKKAEKAEKVENSDIKGSPKPVTSLTLTGVKVNNENGSKSSASSNKENGDSTEDKDYEYSEDEEEELDSDETSDEDDEQEFYDGEEEQEIYDGEEETDEWMYENDKFCANIIEEPGKDSGCTAVVALLNGRDLYVANAGDSRCVVCRGGKAIDMSIDHKPEDEEELNRIVKAGGHVTLDGRVNGGLNLSRAIGDHAYKMNGTLPPEQQMISALPDIKKIILEPNDEFMILACDGIWNYMSSEEVVELVKEFIDEDFEEMSAICEELLSTCLAPSTLGDGTGCDNMTAIIIRFKPTVFKLPTKLDPKDTIINEEKKSNDTVVKSAESSTSKTNVTEIKPKAKKRSVSPTPSDNSNLTSTTTVGEKPEEQSTKRFKSNDTPSSSTSSTTTTSEAVAVLKDDKEASSATSEVTEEKANQSQMDLDAAEADAAAASISTTSET